MRLWYLSHRRPAKAQASLHICVVSPEPLLFAHMEYGSRRRVRPKIRHLAPLDVCTCTFEWRIYGGQKVPKSHELAQIESLFLFLSHILSKQDNSQKKKSLRPIISMERKKGKQSSYHNFPKYSDTQQNCCNHSKIWTMWLYHRVMSLKRSRGNCKQCRPWSDCSSVLGLPCSPGHIIT